LPKGGDSFPRTSMNHRAKFDAAGFILDGEIRNRTNTHKITNKPQTVTNISIPCPSTCVDNKTGSRKPDHAVLQKKMLSFGYNYAIIKFEVRSFNCSKDRLANKLAAAS